MPVPAATWESIRFFFIMNSHYLFENCVFIDFPKTHRAIKGVYSINDTYVGASINIRSRILQHIRLSNDYPNLNGTKAIKLSTDLNKPITIKYLDADPFNEHLYKSRTSIREVFYHEMYKQE